MFVDRKKLFLLFALICMIYIFHSYFFWLYTVDDAFISFRYAENFAQGQGLVFNAGERVEGYTNFLWVVFISVFIKFGLNPILVSKGLGLVFGLATLYFLWKLSEFTPVKDSLLSLVAPLLLALNGSFVVASVEGLETSLFTFLLVVATYQFLIEFESKSAKAYSALFVVGLALVRFDGLIYFFIFLSFKVAIVLFEAKRKSSKSNSILWFSSFLGIFLVTYLPYFIWRLNYYGYLFPNTFYAKGAATSALIASGVSGLQGFANEIGIVFLILALIPLYFRLNTYIWTIIFVVFTRIIFQVLSGGEWMGHYRFLIPVLPFLYFLWQEGIYFLVKELPKIKDYGKKWFKPIFIIIIVTFVSFTFVNTTLTFHDTFVGYSDGLQKAHITFGKWLNENSPNSVLACEDAGALPYYSKLKTIDMLGLTDAHIAHLGGTFYEKYDIKYVLDKNPDYIVLLSFTDLNNSFKPRTPSSGAMYTDNEFKKRFELLRSYKFCDDYYLWVYQKTLKR